MLITRTLSFATIHLKIECLGGDYHLLLWGGDTPHIGSVVVSVPRPSLTGDGSVSVTSSLINRTGHKDEEICRLLAESTAKSKQAYTVCVGGFHADRISAEQLKEVMAAVKDISAEIS